jgi:isopenicillin N synthase-like dioxygenase
MLTKYSKLFNSTFSRHFSSSSSNHSIPLIDLSNSFKSPAGRAAVAQEINSACRSIGFFTITGHNIPQSLISSTWQLTRDYFNEPAEKKLLQPMTKDYPYGYSGVGGENLTAGYKADPKHKSNSSNNVQKSSPPQSLADPKESFTIGPSNPDAGMPARQWPADPVQFQAVYSNYYSAMENLAAHLMRLFALALKLPENYFDHRINRHRSALRALNYPEQRPAPQPGSIRAGEHTDYGSVTILLQDNVGGLQVKDRQGNWINAKPIPGTFVINLGDLMQRWSNDEFISTLHRVINLPDHNAEISPRRQSIAFFHNINAEETIQCLETCKKPGESPKYPPIGAWDLLIEKHAKAMKAGSTY